MPFDTNRLIDSVVPILQGDTFQFHIAVFNDQDEPFDLFDDKGDLKVLDIQFIVVDNQSALTNNEYSNNVIQKSIANGDAIYEGETKNEYKVILMEGDTRNLLGQYEVFSNIISEPGMNYYTLRFILDAQPTPQYR